jgi:hypothetical protein
VEVISKVVVADWASQNCDVRYESPLIVNVGHVGRLEGLERLVISDYCVIQEGEIAGDVRRRLGRHALKVEFRSGRMYTPIV